VLRVNRGLRRLRRAPERGESSAETVIVMALLAALVFGVVQYAVDEHGEQAAQSAAALALSVARAQNGTAPAGQAAARGELAQLTTALQDPSVMVQRSATEVTVTVSGTVTTIFGLTDHVSATAAGPVDRFEPDSG
jgi:type II secretory pathway pseudopilin PulG